ncbi:MAG: 2-oxo acid dehydrogenase subunit E2 [Ruminococcaceae bacterium]|nr:2-oxo acid dehydrogenase subunit E2 [Oscillospiraceae bacterium]
MATAVIMPRQGQSVESCIITSWSKKPGDAVKVGDVLFSYETDKSSFDEVSTVEGTLLAVFKEEGEDVPCLENVCVIGNPGEDISAFAGAASPAAEEKPAEEAPKAEAPAATEVAAPVSTAVDGAQMKISPRAKALADKTFADLLKAVPTGPDGRIIERDVQLLLDKSLTVSPAAYASYNTAVEGTGIGGMVTLSDLERKVEEVAAPVAAPAEPEADFEDVKLPNIRKVIAKSMHASLSNSAQLTLNSSFDATKLMAYRAQVKANAEKMGLANITLNDIVLYAVSRTILDFKEMNAHYLDDKMRYFNNVHLGIAVDTDRGLLVPTLKYANKMSLNEISVNAKSIIKEAQGGTINPDKLQGASFTITNLGSLGVESFTPVINPPQTGILGVCGLTTKVKEVGGEIKAYQAMGLSLTFDHRALDGAPAAKFLKALCNNLENFDLLLAK